MSGVKELFVEVEETEEIEPIGDFDEIVDEIIEPDAVEDTDPIGEERREENASSPPPPTDWDPRRRSTILDPETPITNLRVVIDVSDDFRKFLSSIGGNNPSHAAQTFLSENRIVWESSLVESAESVFAEYFGTIDRSNPRPLPLAVRITDSYQGSWVIEAAVVALTTAGVAFTILKTVSEIPQMFEGLGKVKRYLYGAYKKLVNERAGQRVVALAGAPVTVQVPVGNIVEVGEMVVDPRPILRLSKAPEKRSSSSLAVTFSRDVLSIENLGDRDLHYVRLGVFKSDSKMYKFDYDQSYMAAIDRVAPHQRVVKRLREFVDEAGQELILPPGKDTHLACWVSDADNIALFRFFMESDFR